MKNKMLCLIWQYYDCVEVYYLSEDDNDAFIIGLCNNIIDILKDYVCDEILLKQINKISSELNGVHKKSPLQYLQLLEYIILELDYSIDVFKKFEITYLQTKDYNNLDFKNSRKY